MPSYVIHSRPQGGGGGVGARPPPWKIPIFFWLYGAYFLLLFLHVEIFSPCFSSYWGPFCNFFFMWVPLYIYYVFRLMGGGGGGHFSLCGGIFATFVSMWGAIFVLIGAIFGLPPPLSPMEISAGAHDAIPYYTIPYRPI